MRDEDGNAIEKWARVSDADGRRYWVAAFGRAGASDCVFLLPMSMVAMRASSDGVVAGLKCDQTAKPSVSSATSSVAMPTASMVRDLLSEADAILADSSEISTDRRVASSSCMNAPSSSSVRGSSSGNSMLHPRSIGLDAGRSTSKSFAKGLLLLSAIVVSFALGMLVGRF